MQLTGKEIIRRGIITNACEDGVQQQGIDVRLENIYKTSPNGFVIMPLLIISFPVNY